MQEKIRKIIRSILIFSITVVIAFLFITFPLLLAITNGVVILVGLLLPFVAGFVVVHIVNKKMEKKENSPEMHLVPKLTPEDNGSIEGNSEGTANKEPSPDTPVTLVEVILAWLLGWIGAHKFYRKRIGMGIVYLLTFGLFGFGWLCNAIMLTVQWICGKKNSNFTSVHKNISRLIGIVCGFIMFISLMAGNSSTGAGDAIIQATPPQVQVTETTIITETVIQTNVADNSEEIAEPAESIEAVETVETKEAIETIPTTEAIGTVEAAEAVETVETIEVQTVSIDSAIRSLKNLLDLSYEHYTISTLDTIIVISIWDDGVKDVSALAANGDSQCMEAWISFTEDQTEGCSSLLNFVHSLGLSDYSIQLNVLDDTDLNATLLSTLNGITVYDYVSEANAPGDVQIAGHQLDDFLNPEEQLAQILETYAPEDYNEKTTYVLNTNTRKFHYEDCRSAKQIKDKNREDFYGTRDEVVSRGYNPCGNCHP